MTRTGIGLRLGSSLVATLLLGLGCSSGSKGGGSTGGAGDEDTGGTSGGSTGGKSGGSTGGKSGSTGGSSGSTGGASGSTGGSSGSTGGASGETGGASGSTGGSMGSTGGAGGSKDAGPPDGPPVVMGEFSGNGCKGGTCLNPECKPLGTAQPPGSFASIGFEAKSQWIPGDVVVPTFDDVPDGPYSPPDTNFGAGNWTRQMVDWLDANNLHVDFFVNTGNFCDVGKNATCMTTLERLLKTQNVASHTVHHIHMGGSGGPPISPDSGCRAAGAITCDSELMGVESVINMVTKGAIPHLTRFRAPYGEPFLAGTPNLGEIQGVVKKYAIHVGWSMDSQDANHDDDGKTLGAGYFIKQVTDQLGQGNRGVILMHGTYPWSLGEMKGLLDPNTGEFKKRNLRIATVEDAICWKYGKHSWELVQQINGTPRAPN